MRRQRLFGFLLRLIPIPLHGGFAVHAGQRLEGVQREQDGAGVGVYLIPYVPVLQAFHHRGLVKVRESDEIVGANWVAILILLLVVDNDDIPIVQGGGRQGHGRGRGSAQVHLVESYDDVVSGVRFGVAIPDAPVAVGNGLDHVTALPSPQLVSLAVRRGETQRAKIAVGLRNIPARREGRDRCRAEGVQRMLVAPAAGRG